MKKRFIPLLCALLGALLAACSADGQAGVQPYSSSDASPSSVSGSSASGSSVSESSAAPDPSSAPAETSASGAEGAVSGAERIAVQDAAQFWGVVEDFAASDDGKTVLLMNRPIGTDFPRSLKVKLADDTRFSFDETKIGNGAFLEIYYGAQNDDGTVTAMAANDLGPVDSVLYNGVLVEIQNEDGVGQLVLDPLSDNEMQYAFNFGPETVFHLDVGALKPGDLINVYHSPVSTRSLPPQSPALEVRPYTAPEEGETPKPAPQTPNQ